MNLTAKVPVRITVEDRNPRKCHHDCFFANTYECDYVRECVLYRTEIVANTRLYKCIHDFGFPNAGDSTSDGGI